MLNEIFSKCILLSHKVSIFFFFFQSESLNRRVKEWNLADGDTQDIRFQTMLRNTAPRVDIDSASLHADKSEKLTNHSAASFTATFIV